MVGRQRAPWLTLAAAILLLALWRWPPLAPLLALFRLFVTWVHEAAHSLAALGSGGRVSAFHVHADGSGLAVIAGGNPLLIAPAGYLGAALFGAALLWLANRLPWPRALSLLTGAAVLLTGLFAGAQGRALLLALAGGGLLLLLAWRGGRAFNILALNLLALLCGLEALRDLGALLLRAGAPEGNDAAVMARLTGLPAVFWALLWAALSAALLALAFWRALLRPLRRGG